MTSQGGLLLVDALMLAVGACVLAACGLRPRARIGDAALAFVTGWAALGVGWTLIAILGSPLTRWQAMTVAAVIAVAAAAVARARRQVDEPVTAPEVPGVVGRVATLGGCAALAALLVAGLARAAMADADTSWDVWAFWIPKAESFYFHGGLSAGADGITSFASPEYPPLATVMDGVAFRFHGVHPADLLLQRWLLVTSFVVGTGTLLRRQVPGAFVWPSLAMLVASPLFNLYAASLLADPLIAIALALGAVTGVRWATGGRSGDAALAALFLAAAALTKPEGFLLGYLVVFLALALGRRLRPLAHVLPLVLAPGLALAPWKLWLAAHDAPLWSPLYDFGDLLRPGFLVDRLDRLHYATSKMLEILFSVDFWLLSIPLALVAVVLAAAAVHRLAVIAAAWLLVAFLGLASVYWVSPLPVHFYVDTSAQRVLTPVVAVAVVMTPLLLAAACNAAGVDGVASATPHPEVGGDDRDVGALV
jgi:hypothetical protein